jgi:hypothetical protein
VEQAVEVVDDEQDNESQYESYSCWIDVTAKKFKRGSRGTDCHIAAGFSPVL